MTLVSPSVNNIFVSKAVLVNSEWKHANSSKSLIKKNAVEFDPNLGHTYPLLSETNSNSSTFKIL